MAFMGMFVAGIFAVVIIVIVAVYLLAALVLMIVGLATFLADKKRERERLRRMGGQRPRAKRTSRSCRMTPV